MLGVVLRFALLAIALILMGISFVKAQAEHTIVLFPEPDSLTIYVPPSADGLSVSIEGLQIRVTTNTGEIIQPLNDYVAFLGIPFSNLPTPICFRLVRNGVQSPIPTECQRIGVLLLTQQLNSADVFWYDPNAAQMRLIAVRNLVGGEVFCPSGSNRCELLYLTPLIPTLEPVTLPTISAPTMPSLTPSPQRPQQDALLQQALARAWAGVERNEDWVPFVWEFDGVEMVLVPVGCFEMGGYYSNDEMPIHEQCFNSVFWIDKTEVTRLSWNRCVTLDRCESKPINDYSFEDEQPINNISWQEAWRFCNWRDARLPTESEWEYAARGPDNLLFPWGHMWNGDNVVWQLNSNNQTKAIGDIQSDRSWVGAINMGGNVMEFINSLYMPYPYNASDGRENPNVSRDGIEFRGLRGGSFQGYQESDFRLNRRDNYITWMVDRLIGFRCAKAYES